MTTTVYKSIFTQILDDTLHKNITGGTSLHAHIIKTGSNHCSLIFNSLVNFYAKSHLLHHAHNLFNSILNKDIVSWNSLINGYSQLTIPRSAHIVGTVFKEMMSDGVLGDGRTFAGVFSSVSVSMDVVFGREVHCVGVKVGRCGDVFVGSSLVNVYCKCGEMWDARKVFDEMPVRNSFTWATMSSGFAMGRVCGEAMGLFKEVVERDVKDEGCVNEFVVTSE